MKKLLFIPLLFMCSIAFADPSITNISDEAISGASFGSHSDYSEGTYTDGINAKWKNFSDESLTSGGWSVWADRTNAWEIVSDETRNFFGRRTYETLNEREAALQYTITSDESFIYARFYYRQNEDSDETSGNKPFRIYSDTLDAPGGNRKNIWYSCHTSLHSFPEFSGVLSGFYPSPSFSPSSDTWYLVEVFLNINTDSRLRIYFDGELKLDSDNDNESWDLEPFETGGRTLDVGHMIGYGSDFSVDHNDFDDIYIDYTKARIEVGNNSTFADCTHREIQIPTDWTPTAIEFESNQGSFENGEQCWMFVIDEFGNASAGHEGYFQDGTFYTTDDVVVTPNAKLSGRTVIAGRSTM